MTEAIIITFTIMVSITAGFFLSEMFNNSEQQLINELCNRKQYDFCEQVEVKNTYKLKEIGE